MSQEPPQSRHCCQLMNAFDRRQGGLILQEKSPDQSAGPNDDLAKREASTASTARWRGSETYPENSAKVATSKRAKKEEDTAGNVLVHGCLQHPNCCSQHRQHQVTVPFQRCWHAGGIAIVISAKSTQLRGRAAARAEPNKGDLCQDPKEVGLS